VWAIDNDTIGIGVGLGSIVRGNTASSGLIRGIAAGRFSIVSGNTVDARTEGGISAGPGSIVRGNTLLNGDPVMVVLPGSTVSGNTLLCEVGCTGMRVECPSNVIGNTATGYGPNLGLIGEGCTNIDNLVR
jgi:hypothetical protein